MKNLIEKLIAPLSGILLEEIRHIAQNKLLEYLVEEYKRNSYTKTILYRAEPKKLINIYHPLKIKAMDEETCIETIEINKIFSKEVFENDKIKVEEVKYISIIGFAGSGKSTLVKYLVTKSIETEFKIPIKVELRYLNNYSKILTGNSIEKYIIEEILKFNELASDDSKISNFLYSGKYLFFFDGYDEISSERKSTITKHINEFVRKYNKNYFILTSRPNAGLEQIPRFSNYYICDLTKEEINSFVRKQLPKKETNLQEKIIDAINSPKSEPYHSFLSNPLLLSMFILTFQSYSDIPQLKSSYYRQVFETLFTTHDSLSKLGFEREKKSGLQKEEFEEILKLFSFYSFFKDSFSFTNHTVNKFLSRIKEVRTELNFENNKILYDLEVAIGILIKEGIIYTFPHRSLQEYFAASYINTLNLENKKSLYNKFLNKTDLDFFGQFFADRQNFISLLVELDTVDITVYFIIPLLQSIQEKLNKYFDKKSPSIVKTYNYYNYVIRTFPILFVRNQFCKKIINDCLPNKNSKFVSLVNKKAYGAFYRDNNMDFKDSVNKLSHFEEYIDKMIASLNKIIDEKRSDDSDFIKYL